MTADRKKAIAEHLKVIPGHFYPIAEHLKVIPGHFYLIAEHLKVLADGFHPIADGKKVFADRKKVIRRRFRVCVGSRRVPAGGLSKAPPPVR